MAVTMATRGLLGRGRERERQGERVEKRDDGRSWEALLTTLCSIFNYCIFSWINESVSGNIYSSMKYLPPFISLWSDFCRQTMKGDMISEDVFKEERFANICTGRKAQQLCLFEK